MTVDLKIVPIRDGRPLINDIPNRLRLLADQIDKGEIAADFALVILDGDRPLPTLLGYGDALDTRELLGLLALAESVFVHNAMADDEAMPGDESE